MFITKNYTQEVDGHTFLYVEELEGPFPDYQGILASLKNNIDILKGVPHAH